MKEPRFLFCMTGVGAGNATRELAILRELESFGPCHIQVAAQGMALELMREHYPCHPLETVSYGDTQDFNLIGTIRRNLDFPLRFRRNMKALEALMREFRPGLVLADSDFYCLRPARKLGIRLVSLNNSAIVVECIRQWGNLPRGCRLSYHLVERTDYWLQRRYPGRVLCPTLKRLYNLPRKFVQIPPLVRPEIEPLDQPGGEIVVLTGGSGIDVQNIDLRELEGEKVRLLGTSPEKAPSNAEHVGFTMNVMEHFRRAKLLVVQGGFSSVSEAVALRIPTVVVPIANHAEQWVNGRLIEELGIGLSAPSPAEAGRTARQVLANYDRYLHAARSIRLRTDGHRAAARKLWQWAGGNPP